jgi:O-antigen/teichoic acid export membrane protein
LILATGDRLAVLAFGAAGQGSGAILAALAVSTLMNGIGVVAGNGLWAIDKPRPNFLADVFCMFATIVAAWFLIVPLGVLGAALANLAGMSAAAIVRTITLMRYLHRTQIDHAAAASNPDACLNLEVLSSVTPHLPESTCC